VDGEFEVSQEQPRTQNSLIQAEIHQTYSKSMQKNSII